MMKGRIDHRASSLLVATLLLAPHFASGAPTRVATLPPFASSRFGVDSSARSTTGTLVVIAESPWWEYWAGRSTDGGLSWSPIADLATPSGLLVAGGTTFDFVTEDVAAAWWHRRSVDDGLTWSARAAIPVGLAWSTAFATAPDGAMAAAWSENDFIRITASPDGTSWGSSQDLGAGNDPALAWDVSGTLLACWSETVGSPATAYRVVCRTSTDRGVTYEPAVVVAAFPPGAMRHSDNITAATSRGPGAFLVVHGDFDASNRAVLSLDAGRTWSAPTAVPGSTVVSLRTDGTSTWMSSSSSDRRSKFLTTTEDGATWTPAALPHDSVSCADSGSLAPEAHPGTTPGEAVLVSRSGCWRTTDGALTWSAGTLLSDRLEAPAQDVRALRVPTGRWVALWSDGQGPLAPLEAAVSDDDGASFSLPGIVSDRSRLAFVEETGVPDASQYKEHRAFDAVVTASGELLAAWIAADELGCETLRVSRSPDGATWAPSVALGTLYRSDEFRSSPSQVVLPVSLVVDGAARVCAVFTDPSGARVATRSLDGGTVWSPPVVVLPPTDSWSPVLATQVVRSDQGTLVFLAIDAGATQNELLVARSTDGGASWTTATVLDASNWILSGTLVSAGTRLVGAVYLACAQPGQPCQVPVPLESLDDGRTWASLASNLRPEGLRAGDALGNVYHVETVFAGAELWVAPPSAPDRSLGLLPWSDVLVDVIAPAPGDLRLLWADGRVSVPPGVFFTAISTSGLLRDASIRTLTPRPDFATLFPLAPYAAVPFPGMTDPDAIVLVEASRPLVLYALGGGAPGPLLVTKQAGRVRLDW